MVTPNGPLIVQSPLRLPPTPAPAEGLHERITRERSASLPEADLVKTFREYARGRQRGTLSTTQTRVLRGLLGNIFCDNLCYSILAAPAQRLKLARFEVDSESETVSKPILEFLHTVWVLNRLPALAAAVHWATLRDGNHAVMLQWRDGAVRAVREPWWNGDSGMWVHYDDLAMPDYAVKEWKDAGRTYRTVYWSDRIERYVALGSGWEHHRLPTDPPGWPVPWLDRQKQPLGLPVVHFVNPLVPNDGPGSGSTSEPDSRYGMSELDGGIIGLQDEVNDIQRDISAAARFAGYQMYYGVGITETRNADGNLTALTVEPGALFTDPNPDAKFGVLTPGSLTELERALLIKYKAATRMRDVPLHHISGEWPSGVALLRSDMGLIEKVKRLGDTTGPAWGSFAHKATRLHNTFGGGMLDEAAMISAVFQAPEQNDLLTLAEIAERLKPIVGEREALRILQYSPERLEQIMDELAEQQERAAASFGDALGAGRLPQQRAMQGQPVDDEDDDDDA